MTETAHIFNPADDTLFERVRSYQAVLRNFRNIEFHIKMASDPNNTEWQNRIGTKEELQDGYNITLRSLDIASKSIKQSELKHAQQQGLMTDNEINEFPQVKAEVELKSFRDNRQKQKNHSHSR